MRRRSRHGATAVGEAGGCGGDDPESRGHPGFCKSASLDEVRRHGDVLPPRRCVGVEPQPDDGEPFDEKMRRLVRELQAQQAEGARLDAAIAENLKRLRFDPSEVHPERPRENAHDRE